MYTVIASKVTSKRTRMHRSTPLRSQTHPHSTSLHTLTPSHLTQPHRSHSHPPILHRATSPHNLTPSHSHATSLHTLTPSHSLTGLSQPQRHLDHTVGLPNFLIRQDLDILNLCQKIVPKTVALYEMRQPRWSHQY